MTKTFGLGVALSGWLDALFRPGRDGRQRSRCVPAVARPPATAMPAGTPTHPSSTRGSTHPTEPYRVHRRRRARRPPLPSTAQIDLRRHDRERADRPVVHGRLPDDIGRGIATVTAIQSYHVGSVILDGTSHAGLCRHRNRDRPTAGAWRRTASACSSRPTRRAGWSSGCRAPASRHPVSASTRAPSTPASCAREAAGLGRPTARSRGERQPRSGARHRPRRLRLQPADRRPGPRVRPRPRNGHQPRRRRRRRACSTPRRPHRQTLPRSRPGHRRTPTPPVGVTDYVTTRHDAYLAPFAAAVQRRRPVRDDVDRDLQQDRSEQPGRVLARRSSPACCAGTSAFAA